MGCAPPGECKDHKKLRMMFCGGPCNEPVCRVCAYDCNRLGHPLVERTDNLVKETASHLERLRYLEAPMTFREETLAKCEKEREKLKSLYDLDGVVSAVLKTYEKVLCEHAARFRGILTSRFFF